MRTIHQRVRAAIEKAEREGRHAEAVKVNRADAARRGAQTRRDNRDDAIISGDAIPRNAREDDLQFRALYGDLEE